MIACPKSDIDHEFGPLTTFYKNILNIFKSFLVCLNQHYFRINYYEIYKKLIV